MPTGSPNMLAMRRMITEPTSALAMPPPTSPTGLGVCVRNDQLSELAPFNARNAKIATSALTTTAESAAATVVARWSVAVRRNLMKRLLATCPRRNSTSYAPHQQPGQDINENGDHK